MKNENLGEQLRTHLNEKLTFLERFVNATEKVTDALKHGDMDQAVRHVKERGVAMDRVKEIDKGIAALAAGKRLSVDTLYERTKNIIRPCLTKIRRVLKELGEMDGTCLALATAEHETMKDRLLTIRRNANVARGYGMRGRIAPRFLDMKK